MVSFSRLVKDELLLLNTRNYRVKLSAIILSIANIYFSDNNIIIEIKSSNITLIRETLKTLKQNYENFKEEIIIMENKKFSNNNKLFIIKIVRLSKKILLDLELIEDENIGFLINLKVPSYILGSQEDEEEFLRYTFISNGSINNPKVQRQYHLEIIFNNNSSLLLTQKISEKYDISFKVTTRKNISALYLNKGEEIADFLKLIGSIEHMFEFEEQRMLRDIRAFENRLINAEIANESKKQASALEQIKAIKILKKNKKYELLKDKTQRVGEIRLENPEASLSELVLIANKEISKSNFRHHLNIIMQEAKKEKI